MAQFYTEGYWEARPDSFQQTIGPSSRARAAAIVQEVRKDIATGDLVVEIGCGHGEILALVRDELGCAAIGVEPSVSQAGQARARFGLDVIIGDVGSLSLPRPAQLIVLSHVLEHFHDPKDALIKIHALLAPNGLLWIEVPNVLYPNPDKALRKWLAIEHMSYFSRNTLGALLRVSGFSATYTSTSTYVRILARRVQEPVDSVSLPNEYYHVWLSLLRHELLYWPRRVLRGVAHRVLSRAE